MDSQQYNRIWNELNSAMKVPLVDLVMALVGKGEFAGKFEFSPIELETDSDDYFVSVVISDVRGAEKRAAVAVDFELRDEPTGVNVILTVDDIEAQTTVFSYIPSNYTPDVVTLEMAELRERVTQVPFDLLVERTEELLRKLLEKPAQ
jgi:hypothetical protein